MERFKNVEVGLNYGTYDASGLDVIYVENLGEYDADGLIALTVEEAEWLSKKLMEYVKEFKKRSRKRPKLDELLSKITEENRHEEIDFETEGNESL